MPSACELAEAGDMAALAALAGEGCTAGGLYEPDKHGSLAIHWAAGSGRLAVLDWLCERGMDPESDGASSVRRRKRRTPLHYAARNGELEVVRYLCERRACHPDPRDHQAVSPFQLAVWQNRLDVCRYVAPALPPNLSDVCRVGMVT
jgi:ankyrin repeat protein